MSDKAAQLEKTIGSIYRLDSGKTAALAEQLSSDIDSDPELLAIAKQRLAAMAGVDDRRCVITRASKEFLTNILAGK
jgi:hypothetical protein